MVAVEVSVMVVTAVPLVRVPSEFGLIVIFATAGEITALTVKVAVFALASVTVADTAEVPAAVGVPEAVTVGMPVPEAATPGGRPVTTHM